MTGFRLRYRPESGGGFPTVQSLLFKDSETITIGDIVNLESGLVDLAATGDANLLGCAMQTLAGTSEKTRIEVVTDPNAVYGVVDANARKIGDTLDLTGATGAQKLAASSNKEFVVVADSLATEETLVRINVGKHFASKAQ